MNHPGFNGFFRGITTVFDPDVFPGQRRSFLWPEPRSKGEWFLPQLQGFWHGEILVVLTLDTKRTS